MSTFHYLRRGMAGGFPANMAVKKNKYMEEWNGKREITEKTFEIKSNDVGTFLMYAVLIPYGIYTWSRSEFKSGNDRRYQDIF